jgi:NADH:ubiquinone oxidoreductase subunit E
VQKISPRSFDPEKRAGLLSELHRAQDESAWLTPDSIHQIAERLGLTEGQVYSTASFYSMLKLRPAGEYRIQICEGLSCFLVGGAEPVVEYLKRKLNLDAGFRSPDGKYSLEIVQCLAACDMAPAIRINNDLFGNISTGNLDAIISDVTSFPHEIDCSETPVV